MNGRVAKDVAILVVLFAAPLATSLARDTTGQAADAGTAEDETAIRQVVAGFSDGWNSHDARNMCVSLTGAKTRDGADWPYREGYANYVMAKRNGRWVIVVSHTADFNAKAPGPANR
jgi:hypothetical protein